MKGLNGFYNIERSKTTINTLMATMLSFGMGDITVSELIIELKAGLLRAKEQQKLLMLNCFQEDIVASSRARISKGLVVSWQRALNQVKQDVRKSRVKTKEVTGEVTKESKIEEMRRRHLEHAKEYFIFQYGSKALAEKIKQKQYN